MAVSVPSRCIACALTFALALLVAAPAADATIFRVPTAKRTFELRIKGIQVTTWTQHKAKDPTNPCDYSLSGSGVQETLYETKKAVTLVALRTGNGMPMLVRNARSFSPALYTLPATVERQGRSEAGGEDPACEEAGSGDYPLPPAPEHECDPEGSRRPLKVGVQLGYASRNRLKLTESSPDLDSQLLEQYAKCPFFGPRGLVFRGPGAKVAESTLFALKKGQSRDFSARSTDEEQIPHGTATTRYRVRITLKRVR